MKIASKRKIQISTGGTQMQSCYSHEIEKSTDVSSTVNSKSKALPSNH